MAGRKRREPDLFSYSDFRKYLRDYYAFRKSGDRRYSYGVFAKRAGLSPRGHLKLVADHGRRLSAAVTERYVHGLRLDPEQAQYFRILVGFNQTRDPRVAESEQAALRVFRFNRSSRRMDASGLYDSLSSQERWCATFLLGMSKLPGCRADPAWIERRLLAPIPKAIIRSTLDALLEKGVLLRRGGRLIRRGILLDTGERSYVEDIDHRFFRLAQDPAVRQGGNATRLAFVALTPREAHQVRESFLRWAYENLAGRPSGRPGTELYLHLCDLFPLTDFAKKKGCRRARGARMPNGPSSRRP